MKTKLVIFVLLCFSLISHAQNKTKTEQFIKTIEKQFQAINSIPKKTESIPNVSKPAYSINYSWLNSNLQWQYTDTTFYSYNYSGLVLTETIRNGQLIARLVNTYDQKNRLTEALEQSWNTTSNTWVSSSRETYQFDAQDNFTEQKVENYNSSTNQFEIVFGQKFVFTYNANNLVTNKISWHWDSVLGIWLEYRRESNYIYNSNNLLIQYDIQLNNGTSWINDSRLKYTYNIQLLPFELVIQSWSGNTFVNDTRFTNLVFQNNRLTNLLEQIWGQPNANQWNNSSRRTITYDNFGGSVELGENFINNTWINDFRYSNFYDSHLNGTGYRNASWNTNTNSWAIAGEEKRIHSYNASGNIDQTIFQNLSSTSQALTNTQKKIYKNYQIYTALPTNSNQAISLTLYPNPFTNNCTLRLTNQKQETGNDLVIKLFDVLGKEVSQTNIVGEETQIERGNLPSGIYFYEVIDKNVTLAKGKLVTE